jgi:hypothetical protein
LLLYIFYPVYGSTMRRYQVHQWCLYDMKSRAYNRVVFSYASYYIHVKNVWQHKKTEIWNCCFYYLRAHIIISAWRANGKITKPINEIWYFDGYQLGIEIAAVDYYVYIVINVIILVTTNIVYAVKNVMNIWNIWYLVYLYISQLSVKKHSF